MVNTTTKHVVSDRTMHRRSWKKKKRGSWENRVFMIDEHVDVSHSICFQLFKITSAQSGFDFEGRLSESAVEF